MKRFIGVLISMFLISIFIISVSANVPLTDIHIKRDLSKSFSERLSIDINCIYKAPSWLVKGSSQTTCETTSSHFCYVWVRNKSDTGVVTFHENYGYFNNIIKTEVIKLPNTSVPQSTWHGAYRTIHGKRNLDSRIEFSNN